MGSSVETGPLPIVGQRLAGPTSVEPARIDAPWERRYRRLVIASDLMVAAAVSSLATLLGIVGGAVADPPRVWLMAAASTFMISAALAACGAWEPRVLGQGAEEFGRVLRGTLTALLVLGMAGLALEVSAVRPWVFGLLPTMGMAVAATRYGLRRGLHRHRRAGACLHRVLAVGSPQSIAELTIRIRDSRHFGWDVAGACTATGKGFGDEDSIVGVPVVGDFEALPRVVGPGGYRVVAVTPTPDWSSKRMQRLAWDLEDSGADLVVDPGLFEVAGPRLHAKPIDGFPLIRLTAPRITGLSRMVKDGFDRLSSLLLVLLLVPVFLGIAVAVKLDGGPVFFRQVRVGQSGQTFRMIKFRSMVVAAEQMRADLELFNQAAGPLFKMRHDPRITRVGRWLRRYSLDELPQLFNVLAGSMSLVGPRPPLPDEVRAYSRDLHRRFHVRPGLTGLWQVSGRSNLSWEESIRLDLRYVENWSLSLDALILWKTVKAVVRGEGAY